MYYLVLLEQQCNHFKFEEWRISFSLSLIRLEIKFHSVFGTKQLISSLTSPSWHYLNPSSLCPLVVEIFIWSTLNKHLPSCDGECIRVTFRMLLPVCVKDSNFGRCIFSLTLNKTLDLYNSVNDVNEVSVFHNFEGEICVFFISSLQI